MERKNIKKYGIGCAIADCVLVADLLIDACLGKITWVGLIQGVAICAIIAIIFVALVRKRNKS